MNNLLHSILILLAIFGIFHYLIKPDKYEGLTAKDWYMEYQVTIDCIETDSWITSGSGDPRSCI